MRRLLELTASRLKLVVGRCSTRGELRLPAPAAVGSSPTTAALPPTTVTQAPSLRGGIARDAPPGRSWRGFSLICPHGQRGSGWGKPPSSSRFHRAEQLASSRALRSHRQRGPCTIDLLRLAIYARVPLTNSRVREYLDQHHSDIVARSRQRLAGRGTVLGRSLARRNPSAAVAAVANPEDVIHSLPGVKHAQMSTAAPWAAQTAFLTPLGGLVAVLAHRSCAFARWTSEYRTVRRTLRFWPARPGRAVPPIEAATAHPTRQSSQ